MSWLEQLENELGARGVSGHRRERILAELRDHIACEPGCEERLGDPIQLAVSFADEIGAAEARRSAFGAVAALAVAAVALIVSQLAIGAAGGPPGFEHGHSLALFVPAALGMLLAPQIALVAGALAAVRALRRRRAGALPAAELALIRRRARVALLAGLATVLGLELYVVDFSSVLAAWWLMLVGGAAAVAALALLAAMAAVSHAGEIVSELDGPSGDVFDDVPLPGSRWLRRRPWCLGVLAASGVTAVMTVFTWHAERSLLEGLERGVLEGIAAAVGFALLGRAVGTQPAPRQKPVAGRSRDTSRR
jgi:hypothetical protein